MAIARVQAFGSGATSVSATTVAATSGSSVTAGNGLIVCIGGNGGASATTVSGVSDTHNTYTQWPSFGVAEAGGETLDLWYCKNVATGGTLTVTATFSQTTGGLITVIEVSGQDTVTFRDVATAPAAQGSSTAPNSGAAPTTAQSGEFIVGFLDQNAANSIATSPTFSTALASINTETLADNTLTAVKGMLCTFDGVLNSVAAETFNATTPGNHPWICGVAAFLPAAAGAGPSGNLQPSFGGMRWGQLSGMAAMRFEPTPFWTQAQGHSSVLSGSVSFTGTENKATSKGLLASALSFTGTRASTVISKGISGALSFTGTQARKIFTGLAAAVLSFSGTQIKLTAKNLASSALSFTGTLVSSKVHLKALSGAITFSGTVVKQTNKGISGAISFTGTRASAISKGISGALSFTGTRTSAITKALASSALSFGGTITKQLNRSLSGALSFTGTRGQMVTGKVFNAALSFTGTQGPKAIVKGISGALSFAGTRTSGIVKTLVSAVLSFLGTATEQHIVPAAPAVWLNAPPNFQPWDIAALWVVTSWDTETYLGAGQGIPPPLNTQVLVANVTVGNGTLKVWIPLSQVTPLG